MACKVATYMALERDNLSFADAVCIESYQSCSCMCSRRTMSVLMCKDGLPLIECIYIVQVVAHYTSVHDT